MPSSSEAHGTVRKRVVVATKNPGKLAEIRAALSFPGWEFVSSDELGDWPEVEETGETFLENARIKAIAAQERFGLPTLADDSGLQVDVLDGAPGVYSSRFAGQDATDAENNARLLDVLSEVPAEDRTARFRCVMVFLDEGGTETVAEGTCEGRIGFEAHGQGGFGYDPLMLPGATPGLAMAELDMDEKNVISHRGAALSALRNALELG